MSVVVRAVIAGGGGRFGMLGFGEELVSHGDFWEESTPLLPLIIQIQIQRNRIERGRRQGECSALQHVLTL